MDLLRHDDYCVNLKDAVNFQSYIADLRANNTNKNVANNRQRFFRFTVLARSIATGKLLLIPRGYIASWEDYTAVVYYVGTTPVVSSFMKTDDLWRDSNLLRLVFRKVSVQPNTAPVRV